MCIKRRKDTCQARFLRALYLANTFCKYSLLAKQTQNQKDFLVFLFADACVKIWKNILYLSLSTWYPMTFYLAQE